MKLYFDLIGRLRWSRVDQDDDDDDDDLHNLYFGCVGDFNLKPRPEPGVEARDEHFRRIVELSQLLRLIDAERIHSL